MEARVGIEPTDEGFADLSLTTWVPRRNNQYIETHAPHQREGVSEKWGPATSGLRRIALVGNPVLNGAATHQENGSSADIRDGDA